jgi:hypothetical protein
MREALRKAFLQSEPAKRDALEASAELRLERSWDRLALKMTERLDSIARR